MSRRTIEQGMLDNTLPPLRRVAMLSVHTCPLATPGGYKTGGMNVYVREISRELARRGLRVDIFTRLQESCRSHLDQPFDSADPTLPIRLIHVPLAGEGPIEPDGLYAHLPRFADSVCDFAARKMIHYDLIFSHYWLSGVVAHTLWAEWRVPVVQMFHTLGLMKDRIAGKRNATQRDLAEADIISWADRLIAATPAEEAQMRWLYRAARQSIAIAPPGVDPLRFYPADRSLAQARIGLQTNIQADQKLLLFVGRIEPLKALDTILEALALLIDRQPDTAEGVRLCVVGGTRETDPEFVRIRAKTAALGLSDRVVFLGAKNQDELPDFYRAAEALLMPSDYESFGMAALEAMSCGTPVIASQVGGLAFLLRNGENGLHVPTRDPQALAEAIGRLLSDRTERDRLAVNAAVTAQDYTWPRIADRLLAVFDEARAAYAARSVSS